MSSDALESEDLENVALVRMEDVQPSRERVVECHSPPGGEAHEVFETCIIDNIEFENECLVNNDDDSNLGSVVFIQSDQVGDDSETGEIIVPEVLEPIKVPIEIPVTTTIDKGPDRWPTLEILPGGVIKRGEKYEEDMKSTDCQESSSGEMVYACAQCSQGFKYLFCLVKHVRWHEDQKKKSNVGNLKIKTDEYICLHTKKKNILISSTKANKRKLPKRLKS